MITKYSFSTESLLTEFRLTTISHLVGKCKTDSCGRCTLQRLDELTPDNNVLFNLIIISLFAEVYFHINTEHSFTCKVTDSLDKVWVLATQHCL